LKPPANAPWSPPRSAGTPPLRSAPTPCSKLATTAAAPPPRPSSSRSSPRRPPLSPSAPGTPSAIPAPKSSPASPPPTPASSAPTASASPPSSSPATAESPPSPPRPIHSQVENAIRYSQTVCLMLYQLQRHALPVKAHLRASLVLAYAVPALALQPLLPPGLTLDTCGDFVFLAIALVDTRGLRPASLPAPLGMNFFLSGYRIFTRYRTTAGRTLRGLHILRSDTNRLSMQLFGNLLTHYHYERSQFRVHRTEQT